MPTSFLKYALHSAFYEHAKEKHTSKNLSSEPTLQSYLS